MTHKLRPLIACAVAAALLAVAGATPATAAFEFNNAPIPITATARNVVFFESTGSGTTVNCSGAQARGVIQRDGTGVIPRGSALFANCSIVGFGTVTIRQTADWGFTTTALLSGGSITGIAGTFVIPAGSTLVSVGLCTFEVSGTATALQTVPAALPPALASVSTLPFASSTLGLIVSNASAWCAATGLSNGDLARFNAGFALSAVLSGTLV